MTRTAVRGALVLFAVASVVSCSENPSSLRPDALPKSTPQPRAAAMAARPDLVISQIYGGGGNAGAQLKNDFIEIFNTSTSAVSVDGWSVQYASANGVTWSKTNLTGSLPPGGYYLIQEAQGSGGTVSLPSPDASGTISMSATAGKVALVPNTSALTGACPAGATDLVLFGSGTDDCGAGRTASITGNITAALRKDSGCAYTGNLPSDFANGTPAPRNSASSAHVCTAQVITIGPLHHVNVVGGGPVLEDSTIKLTATARDSLNQVIDTARITWSSSDSTVARVDTAGRVTGVAASLTPVTITATAVAGGITKTGTAQVTVNAPGINWIDVSSSTSSFPVGFQTQVFATARVANGGPVIPATFTFSAADPAVLAVATVSGTGIVTGVSPSGSPKPGVTITATPTAGGAPFAFTSRSITVEAPVAAPATIYAVNDEFGDPTPADASNPTDLLIRRNQYTLSYNETRGTPNWVSYELDARQIVAGQDRCNCFTADPRLPADKQIFTSDYTNGGYDRGHMAKSADRTAGNVDNASTFYLTNIVPQMADLNQGVWGQFENALSDSAKGGRAVYIITGPLYSSSHGLTFLKNEGKVAVPDSTWKVAVIGPDPAGVPFTRGSVQSWDDLAHLTVLAVNMPNVAGVRNDPWAKYLTTVDRIEKSTGYDILSLLQQNFQDAVEAGDHAPVARFSVSGTQNEGAAITFDASGSTDPDLDRTDLGRTEALTYTWQFSDGAMATGPVVTRSFPDNGNYTATVTVTDAFGWQMSAVQSVAVANVPPAVTLQATTPVSIHSGDTFGVAGSFRDPGADSPWQAVLDWGNGRTTPSTVKVAGDPITGSATYLTIGSYTVTLTVTDKDGGSGSATVNVSVDRLPVTGEAAPKSIALDETDGAIKVTLYSQAGADLTTLDLSSVQVGSAGVADRKVKVVAEGKKSGQIVLRFDRQALLGAGVLTPATTQLVVTGNLAGGVQIVSAVPVQVH